MKVVVQSKTWHIVEVKPCWILNHMAYQPKMRECNNEYVLFVSLQNWMSIYPEYGVQFILHHQYICTYVNGYELQGGQLQSVLLSNKINVCTAP